MKLENSRPSSETVPYLLIGNLKGGRIFIDVCDAGYLTLFEGHSEVLCPRFQGTATASRTMPLMCRFFTPLSKELIQQTIEATAMFNDVCANLFEDLLAE